MTILRSLRDALRCWRAETEGARRLDRCEYRILVRRLTGQMRAAMLEWARYAGRQGEARRRAIGALMRAFLKLRSRAFGEWVGRYGPQPLSHMQLRVFPEVNDGIPRSKGGRPNSGVNLLTAFPITLPYCIQYSRTLRNAVINFDSGIRSPTLI